MSKEEYRNFGPNPEHLAVLKEGVKVWNLWVDTQRKDFPQFRPQLQGARLENENLDFIDFSYANLKDAVLDGASLEKAKLYSTNFEGASLASINLKNANLRGARLTKAFLRDANFHDAKLLGVEFYGADLRDTNFTGAELAYAKNVCFSESKVTGALITSTTKAPWLVLKKNYTNTMMLFIFLAVLTFFVPYMINIVVWRSVNLAQQLNIEIKDSLVIVADDLQQEQHSLANIVTKLNEQVQSTTPCFADKCDSWEIWQLLLGTRRGILFAILSGLVIVYNLARIYLTQEVSKLKDFEQITGRTPRWQTHLNEDLAFLPIPIPKFEESYQHLFYLHIFVSLIFVFVLFSFAIHSYAWLRDIVLLPSKL